MCTCDNYGRMISCITHNGKNFFVVGDEIMYIENSIRKYPTYKEKQNKYFESIVLNYDK